MAQQYITENFPLIAAQESLISKMPAESVRDLRSDCLHRAADVSATLAKSKAAPWTDEAKWDALATDIDAIGASPTKWHRQLFDLLLGHFESPSDDTMSAILKMNDLDNRIKVWSALFGAISFVLLSPFDTLPLLLLSHHPATEQLVMRHSAQINTLFHELANAEMLSRDIVAKKKEDYQKKTKKKTNQSHDVNTNTPTEQAVHWNRYNLLAAIDSLENATLIYSLIAEEDREKLAKRYYFRGLMAQAAFDDGMRANEVITALIDEEDEERVIQWIDERRDAEIDDNDPDERLYELILQSKMEKAIRRLVIKFQPYGSFMYTVAAPINEATISLTALRIVASVYGQRMNELWDLADGAITMILHAANIELLRAMLEFGYPIQRADSDFGLDDDEIITPLEYALRFIDNREIIELLFPYYSVNSVEALMTVVSKEGPIEGGYTGIDFLLEKYDYSKEDLIEAMVRAISENKRVAIAYKLFPGLDSIFYHRGEAFIPKDD